MDPRAIGEPENEPSRDNRGPVDESRAERGPDSRADRDVREVRGESTGCVKRYSPSVSGESENVKCRALPGRRPDDEHENDIIITVASGGCFSFLFEQKVR